MSFWSRGDQLLLHVIEHLEVRIMLLKLFLSQLQSFNCCWAHMPTQSIFCTMTNCIMYTSLKSTNHLKVKGPSHPVFLTWAIFFFQKGGSSKLNNIETWCGKLCQFKHLGGLVSKWISNIAKCQTLRQTSYLQRQQSVKFLRVRGRVPSG